MDLVDKLKSFVATAQTGSFTGSFTGRFSTAHRNPARHEITCLIEWDDYLLSEGGVYVTNDPPWRFSQARRPEYRGFRAARDQVVSQYNHRPLSQRIVQHKMPLTIRPEKPGDEQAIGALTTIAFDPMPFSDGTEAQIIDDLRRDGDLTISLVALEGSDILGHVAFSPVTIPGQSGRWFGLGPISVHPEAQRKGVGSKLIKEGIALLKAQAATGCVLIGEPGYYRRFGFRSDGRIHYPGVADDYVQWLSFGAGNPEGTLAYCAAFQH